ncbi:hypothetical protein [Flavobacterium lacus]|uniref:Lipoprotein n=1 Tax=Flavobacterium lacus TaxID=1353778 RepID=A0A328WKX8_9FLAO|nr:hypothetical protein [Flavobacterium lacus]RAR46870.1 hypothetical protein B0I10_11490 [Flavobacterium lacus]
MKKTVVFILTIVLISLVSCKTSQKQIEVDTLNHYTIITYDPNAKYPLFENAKPTTLTFQEILELEDIIQPKILKNLEQHKYYRQYVAAENSKGEKLVWINFFCESNYGPYYVTNILSAADGGNCFFQVKVNLTRKDCYFYRENGEA